MPERGEQLPKEARGACSWDCAEWGASGERGWAWGGMGIRPHVTLGEAVWGGEVEGGLLKDGGCWSIVILLGDGRWWQGGAC